MFFPRAELLTPPRFLRSKELQNRLDDLKNHQDELKSFNFQSPLFIVFVTHKFVLERTKGHDRDLTLNHVLNFTQTNTFAKCFI